VLKLSKITTNNSYLQEKITLRIDALNSIDKSKINILDCFCGYCVLWNNIKQKTNKKLNILSIDKSKKSYADLKGDNRKYIKNFNLNKYDIIDLDAYGIPFDQLKIILSKKYIGIIIVTYIQLKKSFGFLPIKLIEAVGITKKMYKKCPSLFRKNGFDKLCGWLYNYTNEINIIEISDKKYFWFKPQYKE